MKKYLSIAAVSLVLLALVAHFVSSRGRYSPPPVQTEYQVAQDLAAELAYLQPEVEKQMLALNVKDEVRTPWRNTGDYRRMLTRYSEIVRKNNYDWGQMSPRAAYNHWEMEKYIGGPNGGSPMGGGLKPLPPPEFFLSGI